MSDLDYVDVQVISEFPELWQEFLSETEYGLIGSNKFNDFLKSKNINGFATHGSSLGYAQIRHDHLMWMKLKY